MVRAGCGDSPQKLLDLGRVVFPKLKSGFGPPFDIALKKALVAFRGGRTNVERGQVPVFDKLIELTATTDAGNLETPYHFVRDGTDGALGGEIF